VENVDDFLAHYGVMGMKWGKHKRQDDPTDSARPTSNHENRDARRKAKSDKILAKADGVQKQIDDLKKHGFNSDYMRKKYGVDTKGHSKKDLVDAELRNLQGSKDHFIADAKLAAEGKLTNKEKMLIGAAVATVVVAGVAGAAVYSNTGERAKKKKYVKDKAARLAQEAAAQKRLDDIKGGQRISYEDFHTKLYKTESSRLAGMSKDAFDKLDDTPIMVPSGQVFKRVSTQNEETLRSEVYAAFKDEDVNRYSAILPKYWSQWGIGGAAKGGHIIEMQAKEAILSPGKKSRVQNFIDLMDEPITAKDFFGNDVTQTGRDWLNSSNMAKGIDKHLSNKDAAIKSYNDFAMLLGTDSVLKTAYFEKLKSKGFNAIIDDNDAGRLADAPMLIFDANKSMKRLGATVLTPENIKSAKERLIELNIRA
jgi:hypothetical protein